jgi:four helix bundle protein
MFDFEKLEVYSKAKLFNSAVSLFLEHANISKNKNDQLERAAFSIMLNIAERTGRFTKPDKKNFYIIARGSAFECVAIFDYLSDQKVIDQETFREFYSILEEISKMLYSLIKKLSQNLPITVDFRD